MNKPISFFLFVFSACLCNAQMPVQLAPPLLKYETVFFKQTTKVELKFAEAGTQIRYTLNNQTPTEKDPVYHQPIQISKSFTTLKAVVFGNGYLPSETVAVTFIKDGLKVKSVAQTEPAERFKGDGLNTLIDNKGGLTPINAGTWLGYQRDSVALNIVMERKQSIKSVLINCLLDQGSWVFLPLEIQVYVFDERQQSFQLAGEKMLPATEQVTGASCQPVLVRLSKKITAEKIKIIIKGIQSIPEWHQGKGQPGWIFIDEIKLY